MPQVGEVVACVSVSQGSALGLEDGVEAGYEHVGWDASEQRLVDPDQYLPRRRGIQALSGELQLAAGGGHHKRCGYALAGGIPHCEPQAALGEEMEVVEVSSHLPGRLVEREDLPTLQLGHLLGKRGLLDAPRHPKLLLHALCLL